MGSVCHSAHVPILRTLILHLRALVSPKVHESLCVFAMVIYHAILLALYRGAGADSTLILLESFLSLREKGESNQATNRSLCDTSLISLSLSLSLVSTVDSLYTTQRLSRTNFFLSREKTRKENRHGVSKEEEI